MDMQARLIQLQGVRLSNLGTEINANINLENQQTIQAYLLNEMLKEQRDPNSNQAPKFESEYEETYSLLQSNNNLRIQFPVKIKQCRHNGGIVDLAFVISEIKDQRKYKCIGCDAVVKQITEIQVDKSFYKIIQEVHPKTKSVSIYNKYIFPQLLRSKRYKDLLCNTKQPDTSELVKHLIEAAMTNNENDFGTKLRQDISYSKGTQRQMNFLAVCILDFVKLTIPVRHKDCNHVACYELTSLLYYYQKSQDYKKEKYLKCPYPQCKSEFSLKDRNRFLSQLVFDKELWGSIKKAYPFIFKFEIHSQNLELIDEYTKKQKDEFIEIMWNKILTADQKQSLSLQYPQFEDQILEKMQDIYNSSLDNDELEKKMKMIKYQDQTYDLVDKLNKGNVIEYPARCIKCPIDGNNVMDLRSFIIYFTVMQNNARKNNQLAAQFTCPLCNYTYKASLNKLSLNNKLVYVDLELKGRMCQDQSYISTHKLNYEGQKYMLEEFIYRQKISREDTIAADQKRNGNGLVKYAGSLCPMSGRNLIHPLMIFSCPEQNRVSFEYFYEQFKANKYDMDKGLILCRCQRCNQIKITDIRKELFYDEMLVEALQIRNENTNKEFIYDYINKRIDGVIQQVNQQQQQIPKSIIRVEPKTFGFIDLLTEKEYQECFQEYKGIKLLQMKQQVFGQEIVHNQQGIQQVNGEKVIEDLNNNPFGIKCTGFKTEFVGDLIKLNIGGVNYQQQ